MIEMNPIEEFIIENDIPVLYEIAANFEQDIPASFLRLAEKIKISEQKRDSYGIVIRENDGIQYRAAYTENQVREGEVLGIPSMIISKGAYLSIRIENWNQKLLQIGPTFDQILKSEKADIMSPCIEFYRTEKELICMVRRKDS